MSTLAHLSEQTERLLNTARNLGDATAPSLCAGWSRGHVLTHLARNAEGLGRVARAVVDGTGETMYASDAARDADIEAGAGRALPVLVDDVTGTAAALGVELARLRPEHDDIEVERTPGGWMIPGGSIRFMRLREVVYHHVDLDAGFDFADLDSDLLSELLTDEVDRLRRRHQAPSLTIRTDEGEVLRVGDGVDWVTGSRGGVLRWLARHDASRVFGDVIPDLPKGV